MSAFSTLLALINAQIKTNGLKAITGAKLNGVLLEMVEELGSGYQFIDIATPATDPGTPDENVWYIASQAGTYTNFGGIIVNENEVCALVWNGSWTKKVTGAATSAQVNQLGQYEDNPEFVEVHTDADDKVLYGVKSDGDFYIGAGVPSQIDAAIDEKLAECLEAKVDKEEGMSLIDADYAASKSAIENPEYLEVTTDSEDKVLEGLKTDGTKVIGGDLNVGGSADINGDAKILGNLEVSGVLYKVIENPEYLAALVDGENKVIFGIKSDGKTYVGDADFLGDIEDIKAFLANITDKNIDWDALSLITATENPEYIEATTDLEGKVLAGRTPDGAAFENVGFATPKVSIDGATIENIEDTEGRSEITTDSEGKIISYRDSEGVKHEEAGIETDSATVNHLNLTESGMTEFQQTLKDAGFQPGGHGDWSDYISNDGDKPLILPKPRCAMLNIISDVDLTGIRKATTSGAREGVNYDIPTQVEFWDGQGNYFKKWTLMSGQGNSSMAFAKRNIALDFFDTEADGDAFSVKFGNWVSQDSFHLKAYYTDAFRGMGVVTYRLFDEVMRSRGIYDYPWKIGQVSKYNITPTSNGATSTDNSDNEIQFDNGAMCHPDGFPVIVYQNGEFWGIYSWQIKKHRDNYHMDKDTAEHLHLDGCVYEILFAWNGNLDWDILTGKKPDMFNTYSFPEWRNPKNLYCIDGEKYDADFHHEELMGDDSALYLKKPDGTPLDESIKAEKKIANYHRMTAQVKHYLEDLSRIQPAIQAASDAYDADSTPENLAEVKRLFETYLDVDNLIDYWLTSDISNNYDGFRGNWQWLTYDGIKWFIGMYDVDQTFGCHFEATQFIRPPVTSGHVAAEGNSRLIFPLLEKYYKTELDARYKELRDAKIFDTQHICDMLKDWIQSYGLDMYKLECTKWSGFIKNDSVFRVAKWCDASFAHFDELYNYGG